MGRNYAGVLGPLAFLTVLTRGLVRGAGVESTLLSAAINLFLFALIGYVVGQIGGWIVLDSVRAQVATELEARQAAAPAAAAVQKT